MSQVTHLSFTKSKSTGMHKPAGQSAFRFNIHDGDKEYLIEGTEDQWRRHAEQILKFLDANGGT